MIIVKLYLNVTSISCKMRLMLFMSGPSYGNCRYLSRCSVLTIGKQIVVPGLSIANDVLPVNTLCRDLDILIQS